MLEGAEDCLVSSSGMNSATTMLLALVPAGGHIVTTTDCYRRTRQFIQTVSRKRPTVDRGQHDLETWAEGLLRCSPIGSFHHGPFPLSAARAKHETQLACGAATC